MVFGTEEIQGHFAALSGRVRSSSDVREHFPDSSAGGSHGMGCVIVEWRAMEDN